MFLLLLAAGAMAPVQTDPDEVRDLLIASGRMGGSVTFELFVAPDGKVLECRILQSSLSKGASSSVCERTIGGDVGSGAIGPEGQAVHGTIVFSRVRRVGSGPPSDRPVVDEPADLEIGVSRMPGNEKRKNVTLNVYVDREGKVGQCLHVTGQDFEFSRIACQQSTAHSFPVRTGESGDPVDYVTDIKVEFFLDSEAN